MPIGLRVTALEFTGRAEPIPTPADVIVFVGPNNSGKSQALRDIERYLTSGQPGLAIRAVSADRNGSGDDLRGWLRQNTSRHVSSGPAEMRIVKGSILHLGTAESVWVQDQPLTSELAAALVLRADADTRLHLADSAESVDVLSSRGSEPLQRMVVDHEAESRLSRAVRRAFHDGVHVNRGGGSRVHLHLGTPTEEPRLDSEAYANELRRLPLVPAQGDGMRSFVGLLLVVTATPFPLVMVDEPEAFLHPPQARELGRQLGESSDRQLIVATHSVDVLLGLLDGASTVTIIRLRRDGADCVPSILHTAQVERLWNEPSLRYSNILDGLFHRGVVVCEADGDALLYGAALDDAKDEASDLLFTQCGGKHKIPAAIDALRPLGVPVAAIADIDVLREASLLKRIVEALGGDWTALEVDWRTVERAVTTRPVSAPTVGDVRRSITELLTGDGAARLSESQTRRIRELTKSSDGWRHLRDGGGMRALPRGDAASAGARLINALSALGLFVVPVGMLEGWAPAIGKHGPDFVQEALASGEHQTNDALREFVVGIAAHVDVPPKRS